MLISEKTLLQIIREELALKEQQRIDPNRYDEKQRKTWRAQLRKKQRQAKKIEDRYQLRDPRRRRVTTELLKDERYNKLNSEILRLKQFLGVAPIPPGGLAITKSDSEDLDIKPPPPSETPVKDEQPKASTDGLDWASNLPNKSGFAGKRDKGEKGPIWWIQSALVDLSNRYSSIKSPGPVDGVYGGGTAAAVRSFQQFAKISVDGDYGPETRAAMLRRLGKGSSPSDSKPASKPKPAPSKIDVSGLKLAALSAGDGKTQPVFDYTVEEFTKRDPKRKRLRAEDLKKQMADEAREIMAVLLNKSDPDTYSDPRSLESRIQTTFASTGGKVDKVTAIVKSA